MARKGIASIGVDVGAREIRAVEVSTDGRTVKHFATSLLPPIGGDRGMPVDVNVLAEGLRNVFRDLGASSKAVVLGIPAPATTTRVLDIPNVPDSELKTILEGEVQHFGIIRGFGGMFDFMKIERPSNDKSGPQALVMAAEAVQLNALRDGAERARIEKAGIEPAMLGLVRLAASQHGSSEPAVLVAVAGDTAEIAYTEGNRIKVYRRLELSADSGDDGFLKGMGADAEDALPAFLREEAGTGVAHQLVLELKRTIDYVKREFPASTGVKKAVLAVSNAREAPLQSVLSDGLEMPVDLAKAPIPGDDGYKYSAAYGLAIGSAFPNLGVPTFDLSPYDPVAEEGQRQQRTLAFALTSSILIVLASVVLAFVYARQANIASNELNDSKNELVKLEQTALPDALARQSKLEAYRTLSTFGVPVPQVVDSLHQVLDRRTGLNSIEINGASLAVSGESADEASMIQTLEQVRMQPGFHNAFIESFDQPADQTPKIVRFRMTAQLGGGGVRK